MNTIQSLTTFVLATCLFADVRADLWDGFDTYADNAAFNAAWTPSTGSGLTLNPAEFVSGPNSVKNPGTTGQSSRRQIDPIPAHALDFCFSFYDYTGGSGRDFGSLYARGGDGAWTDSLVNVLSIGKYDAADTAHYAGRLAFPGDAVYGDGAVGNAGGWFALGDAADRSVGWHTARITGEWDPAHSGMVRYEYYIDGMLGGSLANCTDVNYNWVVLGSGVSTVGAIAFDELNIMNVPEPSSLALWTIAAVAGCFRRLVRS